MATLNVYSPSEAGTAPTPVQFTATDTFPVAAVGTYIIVARNTTASVLTVKVDDPTSQQPPGMAGAWDPDQVVTVPITNGERLIRVNAARCRDVNGNVNLANTNPAAGTTGYVIGPF